MRGEPGLDWARPFIFSFRIAITTENKSAKAAGGFLGLPGFEALYAVAGLLAVAYLVLRRRK
ncbi:MAG: PGF-CTERM sorting domain-containing protein [Halobacteriota archaeon]